MATKKPAITTQLKNANARVAELEKELEAAKKDAANQKASSDSWYRKNNETQAELDQLHSLLDALPGCLPRKQQGEESWRAIEHAAMTRFASWLAVRL